MPYGPGHALDSQNEVMENLFNVCVVGRRSFLWWSVMCCKPLMLKVAKSILSDMVCRQQRLRMVVPLGMVAPDMVAPRYGCPPIWLPRLRSIHTKRVDASVRALLLGYTAREHLQERVHGRYLRVKPSFLADFCTEAVCCSWVWEDLTYFRLNIFRFMLFGCRKITPFLWCFFLASVENWWLGRLGGGEIH